MVGKPELEHKEHDDICEDGIFTGPRCAATREAATPQMGHEVDREGDCGGGIGERDDSDLSSFVQGSARWRKRPADDATPFFGVVGGTPP